MKSRRGTCIRNDFEWPAKTAPRFSCTMPSPPPKPAGMYNFITSMISLLRWLIDMQSDPSPLLDQNFRECAWAFAAQDPVTGDIMCRTSGSIDPQHHHIIFGDFRSKLEQAVKLSGVERSCEVIGLSPMLATSSSYTDTCLKMFWRDCHPMRLAGWDLSKNTVMLGGHRSSLSPSMKRGRGQQLLVR